MTDEKSTNAEDVARKEKDREAVESIRNPAKAKAIQLLDYSEINMTNPHPDVHVASQLISSAAWVKTTDGTVLIDTLTHPRAGQLLKEKILETTGPVKYIIYTHGHGDHTGGAIAFKDDGVEIIANKLIMERFESYRILSEHRSRISSIQFNLPYRGPRPYVVTEPTKLYDEYMEFKLGDKTFELNHARGETDDHTWVHVPEIKTIFTGDLILGVFPNIGNPFKPTRFALPWARALEAMRDKKPELLVTGAGGISNASYLGDDAREVLDVTIEGIYSVHDQVVEFINQGMPVDEMIHAVKLPDHLRDHRYLRWLYSRPEFAVYNIYRWYNGYFDHNPANLLPRPAKEVNEEIFNMIGDGDLILKRADELYDSGQAQLALQVLDVLLKHDPENIQGRRMRLKLLESQCEEDYCLMSRNTWVYFIDQDKKFLEERDAD